MTDFIITCPENFATCQITDNYDYHKLMHMKYDSVINSSLGNSYALLHVKLSTIGYEAGATIAPHGMNKRTQL